MYIYTHTHTHTYKYKYIYIAILYYIDHCLLFLSSEAICHHYLFLNILV